VLLWTSQSGSPLGGGDGNLSYTSVSPGGAPQLVRASIAEERTLSKGLSEIQEKWLAI